MSTRKVELTDIEQKVLADLLREYQDQHHDEVEQDDEGFFEYNVIELEEAIDSLEVKLGITPYGYASV